MNVIANNLQKKKFQEMYQKQGINYLGLFGSFARDEATPNSDVDLLINFNTTKTLFDLAKIKIYFENTLHKKVDLAMKGQLKKSLEPYINKDLITIYEKN